MSLRNGVTDANPASQKERTISLNKLLSFRMQANTQLQPDSSANSKTLVRLSLVMRLMGREASMYRAELDGTMKPQSTAVGQPAFWEDIE